MRLSTSSSKWVIFGVVFLVVSGCFMGINAVLQRLTDGREPYKVRSDRFFFKKLEPAKYPIVIYGDSRTYRGVATPILAERLGAPAMNLAFSGSGINAEMLQFLDEHVDYSAKEKYIVFGVTPWMFTAKARDNDHFHEVKRDYGRQKGKAIAPNGLLTGITLKRLKEMPLVDEMRRYDIEDFRTDGWCPTRLARPDEKADVFKRGLEGYVSLFSATRFSEESMREFLTWVKKWKARQVQVVAFRIPSCREMVELEDKMSGFDEELFRRVVIDAGATWIDVDRGKYESYDASHLTAASAETLTIDLAVEINAACL